MSHYPASIRTLIKHIAGLPGIGEKTAERLAMHMLKSPLQEIEALAASMLDVKRKVRLCRRCFSLSDGELCGICSDPSRDGKLLCVVEQPADMVAIEKSGAFKGLYHILTGTLSPMNGIGPDDIRISELLDRVKTEGVTEIILATSTTVEGEATADYIARRIEPLAIRVSRIASGVPMGGDLKYVDQVTLKRAMETRHAL
jgi:recombination protein RecR